MICIVVFGVSCGGANGRSQPAAVPIGEVSERYVGCIGPTSDPNLFVLSVAEGRDFTTGESAGVPIPRKSELPENAPPPIPPVTVTTGTPGGGPTPTTKIVTYRLVGDGGQDLDALVSHTVEVLGTREPDGGEGSSPGELAQPSLYVTSIRDLADRCK
jgi:hypothetical protein